MILGVKVNHSYFVRCPSCQHQWDTPKTSAATEYICEACQHSFEAIPSLARPKQRPASTVHEAELLPVAGASRPVTAEAVIEHAELADPSAVQPPPPPVPSPFASRQHPPRLPAAARRGVRPWLLIAVAGLPVAFLLMVVMCAGGLAVLGAASSARKLDPARWEEYESLASEVTTPLTDVDTALRYDPSFEGECRRTGELASSVHDVELTDPALKHVQQQVLADTASSGACLQQIARIDRSRPGGLKLFVDFLKAMDEDATLADGVNAAATGIREASASDSKTTVQRKYRDSRESMQRHILGLREVASRLAGKEKPKRPLLKVDFDEVWASANDADWLKLQNQSDEALTHCTVLVHLTGVDGKTTSHLHYVDYWPAGERLYARYLMQQEYVPNQSTSSHLRSCQIELWTNRYTQQIDYNYDTTEWHNDIKDKCDRITFKGKYLPPSGSLARGMSLDFSGMKKLPTTRIHITFRSGAQQQTLIWTQKNWHPGILSAWRYRSDQFRFKPDRVDVELEFVKSGFRYDAGSWIVR